MTREDIFSWCIRKYISIWENFHLPHVLWPSIYPHTLPLLPRKDKENIEEWRSSSVKPLGCLGGPTALIWSLSTYLLDSPSSSEALRETASTEAGQCASNLLPNSIVSTVFHETKQPVERLCSIHLFFLLPQCVGNNLLHHLASQSLWSNRAKNKCKHNAELPWLFL